MKCFVFDIETTGFNTPIDILQFSYLIFDTNTFDFIQKGVNKYFIPSRKNIDNGAYCVHGLSEEFLYSQTDQSFEDYIPELTQILSGVDLIMGYNVTGFDLRVLKGYNNPSLTYLVNTIEVYDVMKRDFQLYHKTVCSKGSSGWTNEYNKLIECYYYLINNGISIDEIDEGYRDAFDIQSTEKTFHNSAFDTYITYLAYLYARSVPIC